MPTTVVLHQAPSQLVRDLARTQRSLHAGFDAQNSCCWFLHKSTLSLWPFATASEQIITRNLLHSQHGQPTVRIATHSSPQLHAVAVTSLDGNVTLWPDIADTAAQPLQLRVPGTVTAVGPLTPCTVQDTASLVMLVGTSDGLIHAVHASTTQHAGVDVLHAAPSAASQSGLVGALVRGLSRALAPVAPDRPSGQPAVHLSSFTHQGALLALNATASTLELWSINLEQGVDAPHPVSCVALSTALPARSTLVAASNPVVEHGNAWRLCVLLNSAAQELSIASIVLQHDGALHADATTPVPGVSPQPKPSLAVAGGTLAVVWTRGGVATIVDTATGRQWEAWSRGMLDVAVDTPASQMLILDRTQGIVGVPFTKPGVSAVQGPPAARRALSTPQPMQQPPLPVAPDAQAPAVAETLDAAVAGLIPPAALAGRVGGALSAPGPSNPLAVFVAGLVDALPKQVGTSVDITAQLAGKAARLESLLEVLHQAGLLADLTPELLRVLFDAGAQLAAVAAVRDLENRLRESADHTAADVLHSLVEGAGTACCAQQVEGSQRPAWEQAYCMPTMSASALLLAAASSLAMQQPPQLEAVHIHKLAVQAAVRGALQQLHRYQSRLGAYFSRVRNQVPRPDWSTGSAVRAALVSLADAYSTLTSTTGGEAQATAASALLECAEQVLNTFAAALSATPTEQQAPLLLEYATLRDRLLQHLLEVATAAYQGTGSPAALHAVEGLAEAHAGFAQLWALCNVLQDEPRLHQHMAMLQEGGRPAFAYYVFGRLAEAGQWRQLLTLPDQCNQPLLEWLQQASAVPGSNPELTRARCLHQMRCQAYLAASDSGLAYVARPGVAVESAHRMLCMAKLAAGATGAPGDPGLGPEAAARSRAADQELGLLDVQRAVQPNAATRLPPEELLHAALTAAEQDASPEAGMHAVQVFAASTGEFAQQHAHMLAPAWRHVAAASDWAMLAEQRGSCADTEFDTLLASQPLSRAAALLYGRGGVAAAALPREEVLEHVLAQVPAAALGAKECARAAFVLGAAGRIFVG